jgi:hypothetical protein
MFLKQMAALCSVLCYLEEKYVTKFNVLKEEGRKEGRKEGREITK